MSSGSSWISWGHAEALPTKRYSSAWWPEISLLRVLTHTCSHSNPRPQLRERSLSSPLASDRDGRPPSQSGPAPNTFPLWTGRLVVPASGEGFPQSVPGWSVGRSREARPSPRAPHSSTHPTPPAALALSRLPGPGQTPASEQRAGAPKMQRGARPQAPWGSHRVRGG